MVVMDDKARVVNIFQDSLKKSIVVTTTLENKFRQAKVLCRDKELMIANVEA